MLADVMIPHALSHYIGAFTTVTAEGKRVKSNIQMRPMLSKGPIDNEEEFTLLARAIEVGGVVEPSTASDVAEERRLEIIANPQKRRELL